MSRSGMLFDMPHAGLYTLLFSFAYQLNSDSQTFCFSWEGATGTGEILPHEKSKVHQIYEAMFSVYWWVIKLSTKDSDPKERKNWQGEPYDSFSSPPGGSFQATVQEGTQVESTGLLKMKSRSENLGRWRWLEVTGIILKRTELKRRKTSSNLQRVPTK